jgi:nicotinamide-nucleotide amidase
MSITDSHRTLAADVLDLARKRDVKITTAESCTGGLLMATLTEIPGSSDVIERGFITYSNEAKIEMLGVARRLIEDHGAVSERVARAMAEGALRESRADLALSITGIAGPGGSGIKPEGRVCFGMAPDGEETTFVTVEFGAMGRDKVRAAAVHYGLTMMHSILA